MATMRWGELTPGGKALAITAGIATLGLTAFGAARLFRPAVVDPGSCSPRLGVTRLIHRPGDTSVFAVPLAVARDERIRIQHIRPIGSARGSLTVAAARLDDVEALVRTSARRLPEGVETIDVKDVVIEPSTPRPAERWALSVRIETPEAGIYSLAGFEVTYTNGRWTTTCSNDLSIPILVGVTAADVNRQAPVYEGAAYATTLQTHCGIRETTFGGLQWVADPVLDDGSSNPPPGWSNPFQEGLMRLRGPGRAVFETKAGRTATFRPRLAADPPSEGCD